MDKKLDTKRPIRVLQIVGALGMGGAETWLLELLRFWATSQTVQMDILVTSGQRAVFDDEAQKLGANVYYCQYGRKHLLRFINQFRRILARGKYDAIHDHQDYVSGWHFLIALGVAPPVRISHVHTSRIHITVNYASSRIRKITTALGQRLVELLATNICGTSASILRDYGFEPGRTRRPAVSVAHCGFEVGRLSGPKAADRRDVRAEFGWPQESKIVLFAGRLDRAMEFDHPQNQKNSWFALNVVKLAAERRPELCFIMAGAGDEMRKDLEAVVAGWGLSERLRLVGVRQDLPRLMRGADTLLFPSRQEGLGMVAVEAQAAGLPVLASTSVPTECVVLPEMCEFLPLDRPLEEWANALLAVIDKPRPGMDVFHSAVQSSPFSIENSAALLESIYSAARHSHTR